MIITILDGEIRQSAGTLAKHGGVPAVNDIDLAQRVRIDPHRQCSPGRLADDEAIHVVLDLLRAGTGNMNLTRRVRDHAGNVAQHVAIVARGWVGDGGDVAGGHSLGAGGLLGIDRRWLRSDFNLCAIFAHRVQPHFHGLRLAGDDDQLIHRGRIETLLLQHNSICAGGKPAKKSVARWGRAVLSDDFAVAFGKDDHSVERLAVGIHGRDTKLSRKGDLLRLDAAGHGGAKDRNQ